MKLSDAISEYVMRKRTSGLKYETGDALFRAFFAGTGDVKLGDVSAQHVLSYLSARPTANCTWRRKYNLLLHFFDFWTVRGAIDQIPMPQQKAAERRTYVPHVYSREQVRSLLRGAFQLRQRYEDSTSPQTMRTLILFLYATGATVGESVALKSSDVTLKNGTVTLRKNHSDRPRTIPICNDLRLALGKYERWRSRHPIRCDSYFVKNDGKALTRSSLNCNFRKLCRTASVYRLDCAPPAMRDFRPTFAVHRITSSMRTGADLNRLLPALAAYGTRHDPDLKQCLELGARAVAPLSHSHICCLYDIGSQEGTAFIVMEYLEGASHSEAFSLLTGVHDRKIEVHSPQ